MLRLKFAPEYVDNTALLSKGDLPYRIISLMVQNICIVMGIIVLVGLFEPWRLGDPRQMYH